MAIVWNTKKFEQFMEMRWTSIKHHGLTYSYVDKGWEEACKVALNTAMNDTCQWHEVVVDLITYEDGKRTRIKEICRFTGFC